MPQPLRRGWGGSLSLKMTLLLLVVLTGAIAVGGLIFLRVTHESTREGERDQVRQTATGLAAILADEFARIGPAEQGAQVREISAMPNLDFLAFTDENMKVQSATARQQAGWGTYRGQLAQSPHAAIAHLGQVQDFHDAAGQGHYVVALPLWKNPLPLDTPEDTKGHTAVNGAAGGVGGRRQLLGYLHVGMPTGALASRLRMLETTVLATCLLMALAAVPVAVLAARHIVVPIRRLAQAAHHLAGGRLTERVDLRRGDELGELAAAFNSMAQELQERQADLEKVHAGLEETVRQRTSELETLNHRLQAEISEKEIFLRVVSHDLNAPLRNIAGMTSMLLLKYGQHLEHDAVQRLERIQKNVDVECELINELLELSRIKSRREHIEAVDLHALLVAVGEGFSNDLESKGITLRVRARLPVMHCEKARLRQVFMNLLDNAIKYMRPEGPRLIEVGVSQTSEELLLDFADSGMGIAPEDISCLFHVFRRAKSAAVAKIPGKGVGLASVKAIVENYGGRLGVQSQPGHGTRFFIGLPLLHFRLPPVTLPATAATEFAAATPNPVPEIAT